MDARDADPLQKKANDIFTEDAMRKANWRNGNEALPGVPYVDRNAPFDMDKFRPKPTTRP